MSKNAENAGDPVEKVPGAPGDSADWLTVEDVLALPTMAGAQLVAGGGGLHLPVELTNVMEVPDILPWVKERELLLTTGYPLREKPEELSGLLRRLKERGVSAICIKPGRYLEGIPAGALETAEEIDLPLISLGDGVGFDEIIHDVLTHSLALQSRQMRRTERTLRELVDVVIRGGSLEDLCAALGERVGAGAVITSVDGRVRTASQPPAHSAPLTALPCFDGSGRFIVEAEAAGEARGSGPLWWGNVRIEAGARSLGRIAAFADRPLTAADFHLIEQTAAAAALVITRDQSIAAVESKYRADFVLEVLRGHITSAEQVLAHAGSLGWRLDRPLSVAVAEIDPETDGTEAENKRTMQELFTAAWTRVVSHDDPQAAVVGSGDQVILLLRAEPAEQILERLRGYSGEVRGQGGGGRREFSVGVSRPADHVERLAGAYQEAMRAVEVGRQLSHGRGLSHFDSLGVYRLLLQVGEQEELRRFAREVLGPLADDDRPENAGLRETLQALLDHSLNVAETARALFFHYNTLRYRITKLERMVGPFTTDPNLRLALALALQITRLP
ncbi:PucR family transcriptional regulator ligand-binding domain-containing protein [Brevibacterium sp. BRM-1]|uniref:PucR family transcriptional regulator n=1 Tax=Brevibacterium sp. BRM-1 TaxID=2999062 RepID=UPI00227FF337|nr:PucR family transcriptional regulator [Brevibacterium sp. BRM-1]WAL39599.1 PucR family transcriptional regulator ligand-binding domain-containing protein [Brevibacterium sp. BRM-1]